jgi:type IX secretion system PorP/SprF family membrane protein
MEAFKQMSTESASNKLWGYIKNNAFLCLVVFMLFYLAGLQAFSQDPSFSQFTTNNLYPNPGYVGSSRKVDMLIHYRRYQTQDPAKFENLFFSLDYPLDIGDNFGLGGIGIMVFQSSEGDGDLKSSSIGIPISARVKMGKNFHLQFGVMPSIVLKAINWQNLRFGNQLDKYTGYNSSILPPIPDGASENIPPYADFSFGFYGKYLGQASRKADVVRKVLEFGIAMHHWPVTVNESFINRYAPLPYKFVGVVKYTFPLASDIMWGALIQPAAIYEKQGPLSTAMISAKFIKESFLFGFGLRNEQKRMLSYSNFTFEFGFSLFTPMYEDRKWWMILSLDVPVNAQSLYTNTAFEISFNYKLPSPTSRRPYPCTNWDK